MIEFHNEHGRCVLELDAYSMGEQFAHMSCEDQARFFKGFISELNSVEDYSWPMQANYISGHFQNLEVYRPQLRDALEILAEHLA